MHSNPAVKKAVVLQWKLKTLEILYKWWALCAVIKSKWHYNIHLTGQQPQVVMVNTNPSVNQMCLREKMKPSSKTTILKTSTVSTSSLQPDSLAEPWHTVLSVVVHICSFTNDGLYMMCQLIWHNFGRVNLIVKPLTFFRLIRPILSLYKIFVITAVSTTFSVSLIKSKKWYNWLKDLRT